jgi:polyferredoxin
MRSTRRIVLSICAGAGLLLFALLAAGVFQRPAHAFCPYSSVCFGAFGLQPVIATIFFPAALIFSGVVLLSALFLGRAFCGWICPVGAFQEFLHRLRGGIPREHLPSSARRWLSALRFIVLVATVELAWSGLLIVYLKFCPVYALAHPAGMVWTGALMLALLFSGGIWIERLFCRILCPMGALLTVFSRIGAVLRLNRGLIRRDYDASLKCRNCPNYCPMGVEMGDADTIRSADCIRCGRCIRLCGKEMGETRRCIYGQVKFPPPKKADPGN